jgi:hypothetical protein
VAGARVARPLYRSKQAGVTTTLVERLFGVKEFVERVFAPNA